jgi:hypothetical protein
MKIRRGRCVPPVRPSFRHPQYIGTTRHEREVRAHNGTRGSLLHSHLHPGSFGELAVQQLYCSAPYDSFEFLWGG